MEPIKEEIKGGFYIKTMRETDLIEVIDNYEMTNELKQLICLPYIKDLYKVSKLNNENI